jgi:hypothetical protein
MGPEVIAHKTKAFADVKLQSPVPTDKLAGGEQAARTASRLAKHETKVVGSEDLYD